jgi:adhesin transport system membrane fusion protein
VKKGVVAEVELLRLQRQVNELRGNLQERQNKFQAEARADLAKNEAELAAIAEANTARADQVKRTVVRAPLRGTIKNIRVNTIGGIIQPGQDIMEIVPLEDQLLIEARIKPSDVAFLRPGQPAMVKITAYDYSIYGGLEAALEQISADTIRDEKKTDESYYRIQVRTRQSHLKDRGGGALPIIPGMTATVEILTGHKTVLDYLLKPLLKAKDSALRER